MGAAIGGMIGAATAIGEPTTGADGTGTQTAGAGSVREIFVAEEPSLSSGMTDDPMTGDSPFRIAGSLCKSRDGIVTRAAPPLRPSGT